MSFPEFDHYWHYRHGPLVKNLPNLAIYIQNLVADRIVLPGTQGWTGYEADGVAELFYNDRDAAAAYRSPVASNLGADDPNFLSATTLHVVDRDVLRSGGGPVKLLLVVGRSADSSKPSSDVERLLKPLLAGLGLIRTCTVDRVSAAKHRVNLEYEADPATHFVQWRFDSEATAAAMVRSAPARAFFDELGLRYARHSLFRLTERRLI